MDTATFEKLVADGFEQLPAWVREKISNVALLIEDHPSKEIREREGLGRDETLLGYYQGVPLSERGELYGVAMLLPDTITLYRVPILQAARETGIPAAEIIADTIWHEFAHHFGIDEDGVRRLEKERGIGDHRPGMY